MSSSFVNALFGPVLGDQPRTTSSPSPPRRSNSSSSSSSASSTASDSSARARSSFKEVATASLRKLSPSSSSAYLSQRFAKKSPSPPRQVVTFAGPPSYEDSIGSDEGESSKDFDTKSTTTTNSSTAKLLPASSPVQLRKSTLDNVDRSAAVSTFMMQYGMGGFGGSVQAPKIPDFEKQKKKKKEDKKKSKKEDKKKQNKTIVLTADADGLILAER